MEYRPKVDRRKGMLRTGAVATLALGLYFTSRLEGIPYPALWQIGAMVAFAVMILTMGGGKGWLVQYCYEIVPRDDGASDAPDFVITRIVGQKNTVVCRISVEDIDEILPYTAGNKSACQKESHYYCYASDLPATEKRILKARTGETAFFVEIAVNQELLNGLKYH